ncbi:MAG: right-handed parallel beta-helix repeat-containing protein [Pirellulaceae bacterium]|nr:right-handed parallel beta-helix repeat-containing protein [Pirellulaceae bacterium]
MRYVVMVCLAGLTLCPSLASARDIFVDNLNGDDRRAGTSSDVHGVDGGPCRTIAKALRIARKSDRIVLANTGAPYRESISIQGANHSGDEVSAFQIVGNGATLDGTISLAAADWEFLHTDIFRVRPPLMSFQQLFLADQPAPRRQPPPGQLPKLAAGEWCLWEGWIYFRTQDGRLPQTYSPSCCGLTVGITLYDVTDVMVSDLVLRGFQLDGINAHDTVRRTDLVGLNAHHNGRSGISVGGASRVRIDTCAAAGNGVAQIRTEGFCIVQTIDNQLDATSAPAIVSEGGKIVAE